MEPYCLILAGGIGHEHAVSLRSAAYIYKHLVGYHKYLVRIDAQGWWLCDSLKQMQDKGGIQVSLACFESPVLIDGTGKKYPVDVCFPVVHGSMGEDGAIQGLCAMMSLPYVGCDVKGSSLCWHKDLTKQILDQNGIPVVPWIYVQDAESFNVDQMTWDGPSMVKASAQGSSIGIYLVQEKSEIQTFVDQALTYGSGVIVEPKLKVRELEVAVLCGDISPAGEIICSDDTSFYDYDAKYVSEAVQLKVPADLDQIIVQKVHDLVAHVVSVLGCGTMARVDLFLTEEGLLLVNEVNTIPGMTDISLYPKLCAQMGYPDAKWIEHVLTHSQTVFHDAASQRLSE